MNEQVSQNERAEEPDWTNRWAKNEWITKGLEKYNESPPRPTKKKWQFPPTKGFPNVLGETWIEQMSVNERTGEPEWTSRGARLNEQVSQEWVNH
jgi:hypothetical protein